jgi:predicted RNA binding protein YcfA (HicA-like mRNA interferase family)
LRVRIAKVGESLAIRIPNSVAKRLDLAEGSFVEVKVSGSELDLDAGTVAIPPRESGAADVKVREAVAMLQAEGRFRVATRGGPSAIQASDRPHRVTVAGKPSDDLAPGTLNSIFKQAQIKRGR